MFTHQMNQKPAIYRTAGLKKTLRKLNFFFHFGEVVVKEAHNWL